MTKLADRLGRLARLWATREDIRRLPKGADLSPDVDPRAMYDAMRRAALSALDEAIDSDPRPKDR
ncbi:hypothetical protein [Jannaschia formosa]|uniref:hypothetical protein n=1 Tax=Jannaschia formosa TaxID=2259592 RepID=UPI000E1C347C|nr:hypothetical protein [Jannaschia formosa]TFL16397.1 hypothetical protein DR046_19945 [Jannaschia formosa]